MARQRRGEGGGRRPSPATPLDLPATLGSLLRSTLEQVTVVGEAALERARSSRERAGAGIAGSVDNVLLERKRRDALARLGSAVYLMSVRGQLEQVGESPEIARMLADIEDIDDALERAGASERPSARAAKPARAPADSDDGAVSSADWRPPDRPRERMRVWRPAMPADPPDERANESHEAEHPPAGRARARRRARASDATHEPGRGGIVFVDDPLVGDDDDLAEYMHADDVEDRDS